MGAKSPHGATLGVISPVRAYREILLSAISHKLQIDCADLSNQQSASKDFFARKPPDVIIIDTGLAELPGITRKIRCRAPSTRIVALGLEGSDEQIVALAEIGVAAFVPRHATFNELIAVIRHTLDGELQCSLKVAAEMAHRVLILSLVRPSGSVLGHLTRREQQVLSLISEGFSNK